MKLNTILLAGAAIVAATGAQAQSTTSTTIDFRTLAPGTAVTNQYPGVTFSLMGGNVGGDPTVAYYTVYGNGVGGLSNSPYAGSYPTAEQLVATFTTPVSGISFSFDNEGYNGQNFYQATDAAGNVLGSGALNHDQFFTYDLSSLNKVSTLVWDNGRFGSQAGYDWTQALGTLSFTTTSSTGAVPEPATWAMMVIGFGMVGFGLRSRRKVSTKVSFA